MPERVPMLGETVHYVSFGTPPRADGSQAYPSVCRAATVTEYAVEVDTAGLCVINPTGLFFRSLADGGAPYGDSAQPGSFHFLGDCTWAPG